MSFAQYGPCLLCKTGTEKDAGNQIRHIRLHAAIMAVTGCNRNASRSDLACSLGNWVRQALNRSRPPCQVMESLPLTVVCFAFAGCLHLSRNGRWACRQGGHQSGRQTVEGECWLSGSAASVTLPYSSVFVVCKVLFWGFLLPLCVCVVCVCVCVCE